MEPEKLREHVLESASLSEPAQNERSQRIGTMTALVEGIGNLRSELDESINAQEHSVLRLGEIDERLKDRLELSSEEVVSEIKIQSKTESMLLACQALEESLDSEKDSAATWVKNIGLLRQELRFQNYRRRSQLLEEELSVGLESTRTAFSQFEQLLSTTKSIREKLQQELNNALDQTLPAIGDMMTSVYQRLTQQRSFEKVYVEKGAQDSKPRTLTLSVSSERVPDVRCDPADVLNGQAVSALQLVPYFVFSQFQSEALELDLLIVDDPSQSFDTSRVKLLMSELASAASHAQLIIATHEVERFEPQIPEFFRPDECSIGRISDFDPEDGPSIALN
jgi:hypothetical protein